MPGNDDALKSRKEILEDLEKLREEVTKYTQQMEQLLGMAIILQEQVKVYEENLEALNQDLDSLLT